MSHPVYMLPPVFSADRCFRLCSPRPRVQHGPAFVGEFSVRSNGTRILIYSYYSLTVNPVIGVGGGLLDRLELRWRLHIFLYRLPTYWIRMDICVVIRPVCGL